MTVRPQITAALGKTLAGTTHESLGLSEESVRYEGKVRDNYSLSGGRRLIVTTDRISAFDRVLGTLPLKGQILNRMSVWWFERTRDVAPNHLLSVPDAQAVIVRECTPLPVEMVVRAYVTGVTSTSIWTAYARGERTFCGHRLPDGLKKNDPLPEPILTPSTKADHGGHDRSASRAEILAAGTISEEHFDAAAKMALALFSRGRELCEKRGLILVDTKYEFGIDASGAVIVIDEVHTPDSSRFWFSGSYGGRIAAGQEPESFDKEYVRRWLSSIGFTGDGEPPPLPDEVRAEASERYASAFETIAGEPFTPDDGDPLPRLRRNLSLVPGSPRT